MNRSIEKRQIETKLSAVFADNPDLVLVLPGDLI